MLTQLRIKNLALVADLALDLPPGFNAVTGETGAGKSILIGALNLLLGQRADRTLLRAGAEACTVEAVLDVSRLRAPLAAFLEQNGIEACEARQLLLKRSFTAAGTNRQFVNGSPVSLQTLATLGDWLVDIHGPHDHQSLFEPARQLDLLDAFAGLESDRDSCTALVERRAGIESEKAALVVDEESYARQLDLLRHQVREIEAARLQPADEENVSRDHERARNAARLLELSQAAAAGLGDDDDNDAVLNRAGEVGRVLHDLARLDPSAGELSALHAQAIETLRDLQSRLSNYADRIDLDPARLRELEDRLNVLQSLRRKYGSTIPEILAFGESARARLSQLEGRDAELARLNTELAKLNVDLELKCDALSAARIAAVPKLAKAVGAQLRDLGFQQASFAVDLRAAPGLQRSGRDVAEFQFAPNPGEPARPLRAIASSGELARVMLAIKTVLAAQDDIPVVVFDEVDANIGGETAHSVGEKMRQIGRRRQVLCITHLAPVAAAGDAHWVVTKSLQDGRTVTSIEAVDREARAAELARMLGGGGAARTHAQALLGERR